MGWGGGLFSLGSPGRATWGESHHSYWQLRVSCPAAVLARPVHGGALARLAGERGSAWEPRSVGSRWPGVMRPSPPPHRGCGDGPEWQGREGAQGSARWRAGCHFSGRRGEAPSRGGGRVCQPLAVPGRLGWAAPCLRAPVPAVPPRRGAPGCEHLQPLRAAPESAASASGAGRAGPRFGAGRNCEAKSRKQSGALERTEGSRLARAAAV